MTQKEKVIQQLESYGAVENVWAVHNYILRLGAIIHELKQEGWVFDEELSGFIEGTKNWRYVLAPAQLTIQ
jgi:hypothetical protein